MLGCKVFLTYKRKRLTGNGHAHGNEGRGSVSVPKETPLCGPDLYDILIDKRPLGDELGNSSSSRLEAEKDVEESGKGTSDGVVIGLSSMDNCLQNKSCHPQTHSSSSPRDVPGDGDSECIEGSLASYSRETSAVTAADCIGEQPPFETKISLEDHETVSVSKTTSLEISDSLAKDNPTVHDSAEVTKFRAPLITFIRRCKRKRNTEVADTQGKLLIDDSEFSTVTKQSKVACDNTFSHEAVNEKGCLLGDVTNLKPPAEVCDASDVVRQIENEIPEVGSTCAHAEPALDTKVLVLEGEEPLDDQSVSKDVLYEDEKVLDQNDHIADDIQQDLSTGSLGISLNNAVKDFSSNDKGIGKQLAKDHEYEREEFQAILNDGLGATVEGSRLFLDLSVTPTDSSGTVECNAYMESNSQKQSVHAVTETLLGSLDSTSRSHAAISHQTSPPEILNVGNERLGESSSTHHLHLCREAVTFVEGPSTSCKDDDKACFRPFDFMSRNKCLQLFPEDRTENSARSVFTQPEVTNLAKRKSPPVLGLALPTRPKITRFASNNSFATFPFLNSVDEGQQPFEDTLPQSSSSQLSSLLRHKSMLDGIVGGARTLSERDVFQDKLKLYTSAWTEEELDSLWVGVRRYGRDNWNAMIRDPRLRFSSWRVARDLAERWEKEQSKLFEGTIPPLFQHPKAKGVFNNFNTITGIWRETMAEETRLSLGDVYNHRERGKVSRRAKFKSACMWNSGNEYLRRPGKNPYLDYQGESYKDEAFNSFRSKNMAENNPSLSNGPMAFMAAKGNLPHWLREAVFSSPSSQREPPLAPAVTPVAHPHMMHGSFPYFDHYELHVGRSNEMHHMGVAMGVALRRNNLQTSGGDHHLNHSSGKSPVADVIVINSDASSEETISDDRCAGP